MVPMLQLRMFTSSEPEPGVEEPASAASAIRSALLPRLVAAGIPIR